MLKLRALGGYQCLQVYRNLHPGEKCPNCGKTFRDQLYRHILWQHNFSGDMSAELKEAVRIRGCKFVQLMRNKCEFCGTKYILGYGNTKQLCTVIVSALLRLVVFPAMQFAEVVWFPARYLFIRRALSTEDILPESQKLFRSWSWLACVICIRFGTDWMLLKYSADYEIILC